MTLATFNPPVGPSPGTSTRPELRLKKAEFGDGYTQTTRDGLNHLRRVVALKWDMLTEPQADTIEVFFETQGGDMPFLYALRGDVLRQWTCEEWERTRDSPNTVSATLRECFTL
jgi:phage-related protein